MTTAKNATRKSPADAATGNGTATPGGAYFLSLKLENVRCFGPAQTLDLSDRNGKPAPWTIILGVNGTGKTTILQSLVAFEARANKISETVWEIRFGRFASEAKSLNRPDHNQAQMEVKVAAAKNLRDSAMKVTDHRAKIDNRGAVTFLPYPNSLWCCAYGAGRRLGAIPLSGPAQDDSTATLFSDRADLRNAEDWLLRLDYSVLKKASEFRDRQKQWLSQVKEVLLEILPEIAQIHFTSTTGPNPMPAVEFDTPFGRVPLRNLGYGYQTLITWVVDLASRMFQRRPDLPNPLAQPAVVAVDEIDLHLHPVWQRKLMADLTKWFPNTQFIATAHSPLVAQAAADANLAVLRREGDHVVIDNDVENIRGWRVDQILTSDLFGLESARSPEFARLLEARKALLTKPKLSNGDKQRLKELEAEIGDLPTGDSAEEVRERQLIRNTLDRLLNKVKTPQ